jgi:hypothetical protein
MCAPFLLALAGIVLAASPARAVPKPQASMVPLLFVQRETSADHTFVRKAIALAIGDMESAQHEIAVAQTVDVQDEALRAFNTSAAAYNGLADIASKRNMKIAKPSSFIVDDTPGLAQDARPGPEDFRYVGAYQASLGKTIDLYRAEIRHGKDALAVAFAAKFRPRLVHDLELVTIDIEHLDHPAVLRTPTPAPDAADSPVPASSATP